MTEHADDVKLLEDRDKNGEWRVEYFDDDGGCYVTIFAGPMAQARARAYYGALKNACWRPSVTRVLEACRRARAGGDTV
jgi:hypothetical protein